MPNAVNIDFNIQPTTSVEIPEELFGAEMLRFRNTDGFRQVADEIGVTNIRWPGGLIVDPDHRNSTDPAAHRWINEFAPNGSVAEYVYDLKHDNIIQTDLWPREGLREALEYANDNEMSFTFLLPVERYITVNENPQPGEQVFSVDYNSMSNDLDVFLTRLADGHYGRVPDDFNIQMNPEYYGGRSQRLAIENDYSHEERLNAIGDLYNHTAKEIESTVTQLTNSGLNGEGIDPDFFVSLGRVFSRNSPANPHSGSFDDAAILASRFDAEGMAALDGLSFNRYVPRFEGTDSGLSTPTHNHTVGEAVDVWETAATQLGVISPDFQLTAGWAKSSFTRGEALARYPGSVTQAEFQNRTNEDFESYYLERLEVEHDYGDEQPSMVLQFFSELAAAGVDAATYYGVDLSNPGSLGRMGDNGEIEIFSSGSMFELLSENVSGMQLNLGFQENSREDLNANGDPQINTYVFDDDDFVVVYLSVNDIADSGVEYNFDIAALEAHYGGLYYLNSSSLTSETSPDWRQTHGVENLDAMFGAGFQDAEADLYSVAVEGINGGLPVADVNVVGNSLVGSFDADYQVIQVVLRRTGPTPADDIIDGTIGDDSIIGNPESNTIHCFTGNDITAAKAGNDLIYGHAGNDSLLGGWGNDTSFGGIGSDTLLGGDGNDQLYGNEGLDYLFGGAGRDFLSGDAGRDILFGAHGEDSLHGGSGNDGLNGGRGRDYLYGNDGNDYLGGSWGDDTIFGGDGHDRITGGLGSDQVFGGNGSDRMNGNQGADSIDGGAGRDQLFGGRGDDSIDGGVGNDYIEGNFGDDFLTGMAGVDTLIGGAGQDTLVASGGNDELEGGWGEDSFVLSGNGISRITDFEVGVDEIILDSQLQGAGGFDPNTDIYFDPNGDVRIDLSSEASFVVSGVQNLQDIQDAVSLV